ncbi:hypothetical protein D3C72_2053780 [compost metagenome]
MYPIRALERTARYLFLASVAFNFSTALRIFWGTAVVHQSGPLRASSRSAIRSRAEFSKQKKAVKTDAILVASYMICGLNPKSSTAIVGGTAVPRTEMPSAASCASEFSARRALKTN